MRQTHAIKPPYHPQQRSPHSLVLAHATAILTAHPARIHEKTEAEIAETTAASSRACKAWPQPWAFVFLAVPYGVFLGYMQTALPWLLRQSGLPVDEIGSVIALVFAPMALYFLWSPLVDFKFPRRIWNVILAALSGTLLAAAILLLKSHPQIAIWTLVLGFSINLLTCACGGSLIALTQGDADSPARTQAAAWMQGGMLAAQALGGALLLYLSRRLPTPATAIIAALLVALPGLITLTIPEPRTSATSQPLRQTFRIMAQEIRETLFRWRTLPALLLLVSPVGTAAAQSLFAAMAREYRVGEDGVLLLNGLLGGVLTMLGAFAAVIVPAHWDRRIAYAAAGLVCGLSGAFLTLAPTTPWAYYAGVSLYMFSSGTCYAFFLGVVVIALGPAGKSTGTRYTALVCLGNLPIVYMTKVEGLGYGRFGLRAVPALDSAGNLLVALIVTGILGFLFLSRQQRLQSAA